MTQLKQAPTQVGAIGPLDPDANERFGAANADISARDLIKAHQGLNHPRVAALSALTRNDERSAPGVLDLAEIAEVLKETGDEPLPADAEILGATVRGKEDSPEQGITFTWAVPVSKGGSGRTAKGVIVYDRELFPKSAEAGDKAVAAKRTESDPGQIPAWAQELFKALGSQLSQARTSEATESPEGGVADPGPSDAELAAKAEIERLKGELAKSEDEKAQLRQAAAGGQGEKPKGEPKGDQEPAEPWEGYSAENAPDIVAKLKEGPLATRETADLVLKFEDGENNRPSRAGVRKAAQQVLDARTG